MLRFTLPKLSGLSRGVALCQGGPSKGIPLYLCCLIHFTSMAFSLVAPFCAVRECGPAVNAGIITLDTAVNLVSSRDITGVRAVPRREVESEPSLFTIFSKLSMSRTGFTTNGPSYNVLQKILNIYLL